MARLWEDGEMGLYAGGTWDSWRCRSWRIILMSDDILDSNLGTEQPSISAVHPAASHRSQTCGRAREALGKRCRFSCLRVMMLCLVLLGEVFSRASNQRCHREINPAISLLPHSIIPCPIFCEAKLGSGAEN